MAELESDILVEILDQDLPKLSTLYQEKAPWAPIMTSLVNTTLKWKNLPKHKNRVRFFSPGNTWNHDGTIIVVIKWFFSQDIVVFTLNDQSTNLYKGLTETNLIRYGKGITAFYNVHEKHVPIVEKFIEDANLKTRVFANSWCVIYSISLPEALKFTIECPSEVYIQKLTSSSAKQINDVWPYRFPNSEMYIATYIELTGGYGLFLKSTHKLVSWIVKHPFGHFSMLQTEEQYKRKGYGTLMTKILAKKIAREGFCPHGTVVVGNNTSQSLFEKLGFRNVGTCCYTFLE